MIARLRPAAAPDTYALWLWANDPETRAASFGRGPIEWADHVAWLTTVLRDSTRRLYIAESADGRPLGSVRFDLLDNGVLRLSYALSPEARGQGLAQPLVAAGVQVLRADGLRASVQAEVSSDNPRSLRVFRNLGWEEEQTEARHVFRWNSL